MLLIREAMYASSAKSVRSSTMHCHGGDHEEDGNSNMRFMTELAGECRWTIVAELEIESLDAFDKTTSG